jgi:hypothetical protein
MRKHLFVFALLIGLLFSCDKNDDIIKPKDRNEALFGQWEYAGIMSDRAVDIDGNGTSNIDLYNTNEIRQCIKDNLTFFASRGEGEKNAYSINENGLSCGEVAAFNTVEQDRYELIENETLRFDNGNDWTIVELTKSKLVVETKDCLEDTEVVITYTFQKS